MSKNILLIDNYDSFTFNLCHQLMIAGATVKVLRNDDVDLLDQCQLCDALVISPGPSNPDNSGLSKKVVFEFYRSKRILGVCLGMQVLNEVFGGKTARTSVPVHGKISHAEVIKTDRLFPVKDESFEIARYHSLYCSDIANIFEITVVSSEIPMAISHKELPLFGLQFHPESFMTPAGQAIVNRFVGLVR